MGDVLAGRVADEAAVRANVARAARFRRTWPQVAFSLGLVHEDRNPNLVQKYWNGETRAPDPVIRVPRIMHMSVDSYGVTMVVRTVRGVGRKHFTDAAGYLADEWRMRQVWARSLDDEDQWGPGFVELRTVHTDPLTRTVEQGRPPVPLDLSRLELGHGERGQPEYLPLAQGAGVTVMGASGFGKTMFARNIVVKLAPSPKVQFAGANGKTTRALRGDYRVLAPRYAHLVGSDPYEVNELLTGLVNEMYRRLDSMYDWWGVDEFWDHGPSIEIPYLVTTLDECQVYLATTAPASSNLGKIVTDNVEKSTDLVKMGRAAGMGTFFMTQKGTGDAIPTAIRDVATTALSFPVRSRAQAMAALGDEILDYPDKDPRAILRHPYRGVGTLLAEGSEGFTRFKSPLTSAELAAEVCEATAHYVREIPGMTVGRTRVPDTGQAIELSKARAARAAKNKPRRIGGQP
ncbi:FtsK/SpoIIIE domain-containing protein [Nocardia sp. NPDC059228]|uniref:FtsK/SpoIIIE domain-containing protein n=1 Tax=Nocardia sp. NPDC059228 TaxID=3346777 RepID=UPI0036913584